jgi:hypothetical protein
LESHETAEAKSAAPAIDHRIAPPPSRFISNFIGRFAMS